MRAGLICAGVFPSCAPHTAEEDAYAGYEAEPIPHPKHNYQYHTPHPSQWHSEDRPRKAHPAARGGGRGRGRAMRDDV